MLKPLNRRQLDAVRADPIYYNHDHRDHDAHVAMPGGTDSEQLPAPERTPSRPRRAARPSDDLESVLRRRAAERLMAEHDPLGARTSHSFGDRDDPRAAELLEEARRHVAWRRFADQSRDDTIADDVGDTASSQDSAERAVQTSESRASGGAEVKTSEQVVKEALAAPNTQPMDLRLPVDLREALLNLNLNWEYAEGLAALETQGQPEPWQDITLEGRGAGGHGRFHLRTPALQDAGLLDMQGNWTGKYGIDSWEELRANPAAQVAAAVDYARKNEGYAARLGHARYLRKPPIRITTGKGDVVVTPAALIGAMHFGQKHVMKYLQWAESKGWNTENQEGIPDEGKTVEYRLRELSHIKDWKSAD